MSQSRDEMIAALKKITVPVVRELGFKGSFPHFRRASEQQIDLLTFQFSQWGGLFYVIVGSFPASGFVLAGQLIPPRDVRIRHLSSRIWLGDTDAIPCHAFEFENGNYDAVAASVIPYIRGQAIAWWASSATGI